MINIAISRKKGIITGFEISGHSTYAKPGQDIVCAAVSTLSQAALMGLMQIAEVDIEHKVGNGYIYCEITDSNDKASTILDTMLLGITEIQRQYQDQIKIKEVVSNEKTVNKLRGS